MGVSVAEYLGQRTDVDNPTIEPVVFPITNGKQKSWDGEPIKCPFNSGNPCKKIISNNEPVCSVRKPDGTLWINCPERLCSTKKDIPLNDYQKHMLLKIARFIYSEEVEPKDVCVKREEQLSVVDSTKYNADYIMSLRGGRSDFPGPDRLVLEMQGGGETSNTGSQTNHIKKWREMSNRTNAFLREETRATTLETNAWRRQQEQFIVKGNIAMKTWKGYGIAFCVGTLLYDYLIRKLKSANLPDLRSYNWTLALIAIKEDTSKGIEPGPIPLEIDKNRILFTNYQTFVQALINQGEPSLDAFKGEYVNLNNDLVIIN